MNPEKLPEKVEESLRADPVPWDELRERRVLGDIQQQLAADSDRTGVIHSLHTWQRRAMVAVTAGILLCVGAVLLGILGGTEPASSPEGHVSLRGNTANGSSKGSIVRIAGLGKATMSANASMTFEKEVNNEIYLSQTEGRVSYTILPQRDRTLVIGAKQVEVRVIGTAFEINIEKDTVSVNVTEGKVSVTSGDRHLVLGAGERFESKSKPGDEYESARATSTSRQTDMTRSGTNRSVEKIGPVKPNHNSTMSSSSGAALETGDANEISRGESSKGKINPVRGPDFTVATVDTMLRDVDSARKRGDFRTAATLLRQVVKTHANHPNVPIFYFTLGNIEFASGEYNAAAAAYRKYLQTAPDGILSEDAFAAIADAMSRTGDRESATTAARRYLNKYSKGVHAARMRALAE